MKHNSYIIFLILGILCTSCERTIDFVDTSEALDHNLTINAIAVEGSPLGVFLNRTYSIKDSPILPNTFGYEEILNYTVDWGDLRKNDFINYTAILDARVEAVVNGSDRYLLTLTADSLGYWTDYRPKVGDHIKITAIVGSDEAYSEVTIPAKPKLEVLEHELFMRESTNPDDYYDYDWQKIDTIMRLKCRLSDPGGEHYYRLRVRSERESMFKVWSWKYRMEYDSIAGTYHYEGDEYLVGTYIDYKFINGFSSNDPLFKKNSLDGQDKGTDTDTYIEEYWNLTSLTNTFNNDMFYGKDYTFNIDVKKQKFFQTGMLVEPGQVDNVRTDRDKIEDAYRVPPRVLIELQELTPDYYKYLKTMEKYVDSNNDKKVVVGIYSNVQNGFGIFGALSYDRHFVEYGE